MTYKTDKEFMDALERKVKRMVKYYRDDFYIHDRKTISENPKAMFLWMTRECGTWMFVLDDEWDHYSSKWLRSIICQGYKIHNWYLLSGREIKKLDDETVERFADRIFRVTEEAERMEIPISKLKIENEIQKLKTNSKKRRAA